VGPAGMAIDSQPGCSRPQVGHFPGHLIVAPSWPTTAATLPGTARPFFRGSGAAATGGAPAGTPASDSSRRTVTVRRNCPPAARSASSRADTGPAMSAPRSHYYLWATAAVRPTNHGYRRVIGGAAARIVPAASATRK
jgi:hypothetical protein